MKVIERPQLKDLKGGEIFAKMKNCYAEELQVFGGVITDDDGEVIDFWSQSLLETKLESGDDGMKGFSALWEGAQWPLGDDEHGRDGLFEGNEVRFLILDLADLETLSGMIERAKQALK